MVVIWGFLPLEHRDNPIQNDVLRKMIARLLRVPEVEVLRKRQQRSGVKGIPLSYLEERMSILAEFGSWDALADTLGLAVYGVILLPHLNDYIDLAVIDAFIVVREKCLSPMVVVLANTYYSLQRYHGSRGHLICCLPALYIWLISHTFASKRPTHDYPVIFLPTDESISPLHVHGLGIHHVDILRRIRMAWGYTVKKGKELGPQNHGDLTAYQHWLQHRVDMVRIPFSKIKSPICESEETV
ncbi:hypothetical protein CR513_44751, partial [Mucuna pruriens]